MNYNLEIKMAIGLIMTILLFLLVGYYWATEPAQYRSVQFRGVGETHLLLDSVFQRNGSILLNNYSILRLKDGIQ